MLDIKAILPLHEFNDAVKPLLKRAIDGYRSNNYSDDTLVIVANKSVCKAIKNDADLNFSNFIVAPESVGTKIQSLVNYAVSQLETKYFMVIEYDDYLTSIWLKNAESYIESGDYEASVYMPLTEIEDFQNKELGIIGYTNEAPWATSFSEEIGYIDFDCLQDYTEFNLTGAIFNKSDFEECGRLKESMELTFWYELLLRMTNQKKRVFVVPKVGYIHTVNRPGSLIHQYSENMTTEEADWWLDLAKKEYFFKVDRNKKYEE